MNEVCASEQGLIQAMQGMEFHQRDLAETRQRLLDWLHSQTQLLAEHKLQRPHVVRQDSVLAQELAGLGSLVSSSLAGWTRQWEQLQPARQLAESFEQKLMLLVFGKFNAGKSSLCNLLAQRFAANGQAVQYFHLSSGCIVGTQEPFREGATETTARLQGVCLGSHLVLLDTPGQHSVTGENATLTQSFTDSADAVLWLTSSTSPGQVQELAELSRELHRHKPLLPVITRSDVWEEDEADGQIIKLLRNKTPENRLLQEVDAGLRAREKLRQMGVDQALLKPAVSVSAHVVRAQGQTVQALREGGLSRLYEAILAIAQPAAAYRQRKPAEVLLHHLEENVQAAMSGRIQPALWALGGLVQQERERLATLKPRFGQHVLRQVLPELPGLLERHAEAAGAAIDVAVVRKDLQAMLQAALAHELDLDLGAYGICLELDGSEPVAGLPSGLSHEQGLHDGLQELVRQQVLRQLDAIFGQCDEALERLHGAIRTLLDLLPQQAACLLEIKRSLRTGMA